MRILIDADTYIALYNKDDALHNKANKILNSLKNKDVETFTTYDVVDEVATKLSYFLKKSDSLRFLKQLMESETEIIYPTENSLLETIEKVKSIRSKRVSFTDCANMIAYKHYDIDAIFSFDKIYEKQGIKTLKP
ncbi:PIN domain-containing protein [candidate division WWE3 bacterium]|nr:PIN domain-containing protein [candidate division WWE3 bacterium]